MPERNERLTIVVIDESSSGRHSLRSQVGIESREHVDDGDFMIIRWIVSSDTSQYSLKVEELCLTLQKAWLEAE